MKIGFIGLGIMGKPMAKHLLKAGYELYVHNRSQQAVQELEELGAVPCSDPKQVASLTQIVITMLPDSPQVEEVVVGDSGHSVSDGIARGGIVIDMSSIHPLVSQRIAERLKEKGACYMDAPVSGGEIGAIQAKLAIMVGGAVEQFAQIRPILACMGSTITHVGDVGAGNAVKLMNQMIVAGHIAALSEAMAFGRAAGIDPLLAFEAIRGGLAGSRVMETKINAVAEETFVPGFRLELHAKDLRNAVSMGEQTGANMLWSQQILDIFEQLIAQGRGREDHSALYRYFTPGKGGEK